MEIGVTSFRGLQKPVFKSGGISKPTAQLRNGNEPDEPNKAVLPSIPRPYLAPSAIRFGGLIDEDYNVQLRGTEPINAETTSALLQGLLVRNAIKKAKNDPSSLKLFLDSTFSDSFLGTSRASLADILTLVDRPVDIIVKEDASDMGMLALQSATGKRLMYDGARISLGPIEAGAPYMRNDDHAVRREFSNEYIRDLEHRIMARAGIENRSELYWRDLNGVENLNSLQALARGKNGLVDAIIVQFDRVVTREDLDKYVKRRGFDEKKKQEFLSNQSNINKIPSRSLAEFSPESIPPQSPEGAQIPDITIYRSPKEQVEAEKKKEAEKSATDGKAQGTGQPQQKEPDTLTFYAEVKGKALEIPAKSISLSKEVKTADVQEDRLFFDNLVGRRAFLEDDVIFFNDGFVDETAKQVTKAIADIDRKKRKAGNGSNGKIVVNSPGGSISSGLDIRSTIAHSKSKFDVIVTGMAASCGAFLVSSATGNRLATPNARIMIHDAWWSRPKESNKFYNQSIDSLNQVSKDFVRAISDASGRSFDEVWKDMKIDVWLNPLEAMFYGKHGLCDAILVGDNKAITKKDVFDYLVETLGSEKEANKYLKKRIDSLRVGKTNWKPEEHNERDPFENPLRTVELVARKSARDVDTIPELASSVPKADQAVDMRIVAISKKPNGGNIISEQSREILQFACEKISGPQ